MSTVRCLFCFVFAKRGKSNPPLHPPSSTSRTHKTYRSASENAANRALALCANLRQANQSNPPPLEAAERPGRRLAYWHLHRARHRAVRGAIAVSGAPGVHTVAAARVGVARLERVRIPSLRRVVRRDSAARRRRARKALRDVGSVCAAALIAAFACRCSSMKRFSRCARVSVRFFGGCRFEYSIASTRSFSSFAAAAFAAPYGSPPVPVAGFHRGLSIGWPRRPKSGWFGNSHREIIKGSSSRGTSRMRSFAWNLLGLGT